MHMKHEKSCGAVCCSCGEGAPRVLVIRGRFGGRWAFPKGHVKEGESERETAVREVWEETGARIELLPGFREVTTYSPARGVMKDVVFFAARITGGTLRPQPEEVRAVCLLPMDEAARRLAYAADRALLAHVRAFLEQPAQQRAAKMPPR